MKFLITFFIFSIIPFLRMNVTDYRVVSEKGVEAYTDTGYDQFKEINPVNENSNAINYLKYTENKKLDLVINYFNRENPYDFVRKTVLFTTDEEPACRVNDNGSYYYWESSLYDEETGELNTSAILEMLFTRCKSGEKEFRLTAFKDMPEYKTLYSTLTDEDAIIYLSDSEKLGALFNLMTSSNDWDKASAIFNFTKSIEYTPFYEGSKYGATKTLSADKATSGKLIVTTP